MLTWDLPGFQLPETDIRTVRFNNMSHATVYPSEKSIRIGELTLDEYLIANFGRFEQAFRTREEERKEAEKLLNQAVERTRQKKITGYLVRGRADNGDLILEEIK